MVKTPTRPGSSGTATLAPAHTREHLEKVISDLVINGSIEFSMESDDASSAALASLPLGMAIYLPGTSKRSLQDNLARIRAVHQAGFDPVPHIAARQVPSLQTLRDFLDRAVQDCKVHRVMLIGGDTAGAAGPFADGAALLKSGVLSAAGIHEVDAPGYPEGHPRISAAVAEADLRTKLDMARDQGLGLNLVTQFSFLPSRVVEYCDELAHKFPEIPVYVGLAGPTDTESLLRFARMCGVSESLRALSSLGVKAAMLACHTSPDEQVEVLARYCAGHEASNVIGIHVYSFGGFARAVEWMQGKIASAA